MKLVRTFTKCLQCSFHVYRVSMVTTGFGVRVTGVHGL